MADTKEKKKNSNWGGKREGAGRRPRAEELKANYLINKALKLLYGKEEEEDNVVQFLTEFAQTGRGQQFIAEHLLGKPTEQVNVNVGNESVPVINWVKNN